MYIGLKRSQHVHLKITPADADESCNKKINTFNDILYNAKIDYSTHIEHRNNI